jgi:hypothetical protein
VFVTIRKIFVVFDAKVLLTVAMRHKPSRLIGVAVVLLLLASCVSALPWVLRHRSQAARREWKNEAIPAIASWAEDSSWRAKEMMILTNRTTDKRVLAEGWLTDKMILTGSGEWLVYMSHCSKAKPHIVNDIFLAKGSDGKWYYSTFHFCVGMVGLLGEQETQPPGLKMFVHEYNLREFDGRSDEGLEETKPWPASWDEKKPN